MEIKPSKNKIMSDAFVEEVFFRKQQDKGYRVRLRAAMNPLRESKAWGDIAPYVDLTHVTRRRIYLTVASAIALSDEAQNGDCAFGAALRKSWDDKDSETSPSSQRLRKLLSCNSAEAVCAVIRPILRLIDSRKTCHLDYAQLLKQLLFFDSNPEAVKARWAQDYFAAFEKEQGEQK